MKMINDREKRISIWIHWSAHPSRSLLSPSPIVARLSDLKMLKLNKQIPTESNKRINFLKMTVLEVIKIIIKMNIYS